MAKLKRVKKVFNSCYQVYHLWANEAQDDARQGGRLPRSSFYGSHAYSYNACIGVISEYRGVKVGVVSSHRYSNTTSKHQSSAYSALYGLMPRIKSSNLEVFQGLVETQGKLVDDIFNLFNHRKFYIGYNFLDKNSYFPDKLNEFNKTCIALKHKELVINIPDDLKSLLVEHIKACQLRQIELNASANVRKIERDAKELAKNLGDLDLWRDLAIAPTHYIRSLRPMLLRVKGNVVETSSGAEVPLAEAKALVAKIIQGKAQQGDPVGSFTLDSVSMDTVKIGCHIFNLNDAIKVLKAG